MLCRNIGEELKQAPVIRHQKKIHRYLKILGTPEATEKVHGGSSQKFLSKQWEKKAY